MKIAYISSIFFSDVDISFLSELRRYADVYYYLRIGWTTKAAAVNIGKSYPLSGVFPILEVYPEFNIYKNLLDLDKVFVVNQTKLGGSLDNWNVTWQLFKHLKKNNFDVIHNSVEFRYYEFPLYYFRNKILMSVHDPIQHSSLMTNRMVNFYRNVGFRLLHNFLIFNKTQKDDFIKINKLEKKNVYDSELSVYSFLNMYKKERVSRLKKKFILFFGQIQSHKGIEFLCEAMTFLHKNNPDVELVIAGGGKFYFDITEYESCGYIKFINRFIPNEELVDLINQSEFVVCPYKDATQSGVVMSSFALLKPIIATNVGGLPEMIEHGKTGLLVPPCSSLELFNAMFKLLNDDILLKEMSNNINLEYFQGRHSWGHIVKNVYSYYEKIGKRKKNIHSDINI